MFLLEWLQTERGHGLCRYMHGDQVRSGIDVKLNLAYSQAIYMVVAYNQARMRNFTRVQSDYTGCS